MPYAPGITDISGQLLAEGIRGAAATYAESQDKLRLTDKEIAHLKGTVEFAASKNILTPEQLAEFNTGNLAKKREVASLAGMAYQDLQDEENRKANLFVPTTEELARLTAGGYVRTGLNHYDQPSIGGTAADFQFDPAKHVVPIPGGGTYIQTGRGGGTFTGGNAQSDPTEEDKAIAAATGYSYIKEGGKWVTRAKRGDAAGKPSPAQDVVDAIYRENGTPTVAARMERQKQIMDATKRPTLPVPWSDKNPLGETLAQEYQRLQREIDGAATPPRTTPTPAEIQAIAPVRTSAQVKPSAGRGKFAGPIQPAPALPLADPLQQQETGDVLPPLPNAKKPVSPAVLAELNAALQKGADKAALLKRLEENGYSTEGLQ